MSMPANIGAFAAARRPAHRVALSVITPVYNEAGNIGIACEKLFAVLERLPLESEVIAVNDGSQDGSLNELIEQTTRFSHLKVIDLRRNYGQTAAIMAGIDHALGDIIVTIDADLQNDPEDIPALLNKLQQGYDVVSGWRKERQDSPFRRNLVSRVANRVISRISGVPLNDYGCTLKAYRRDILQGMRLYGEMHRFIPVYASWMGAKIVELPVSHHPRRIGESKYGLERIFNASTLTVDDLRVKQLSDDVAIVHAAMTLSGQTAIATIGQPGARKTIFSFVLHRAGGGWLCVSAHNTDVVPNMETNVIGDDGSFRAANYRIGQVS